jgi:hypothetical protein
MPGGTLTVNQEKQMRTLRNAKAEAAKPQEPVEPDLVLYMKLARLYGEFRALKNRMDREAAEIRRNLLAQMDEVWAELNT